MKKSDLEDILKKVIASVAALLVFAFLIVMVAVYLFPCRFGYDSIDAVFSVSVLDHVRILLFGLIAAVIGAFYTLGIARYGGLRIPNLAGADASVGPELSTQQMQLLYDNSPVPYFVMDDHGRVHNANMAALRFFGATLEELKVISTYDLIVGVRRDKTKESKALLISKVERGVSVADEEVYFRIPNGKERIALMSIYSLDKNSLMPYRHLVALQDVTKERKNEEVKTDFLLLASHQLRTPATTIKWYTEYLLGSKSIELTKEVRDYLQEIYVANERMTDLVATLLTVSHVEMGTLTPESAPVSLGDVIDDVARELRPDMEKRKQELIKDIDQSAHVFTDGRMMRIAIHNLLTNAVKYTHKGGKITVRVKHAPESSTISVEDNGAGIPLDEQDRIFSKMFRATNAKKLSTNGTGLGLYLTKSFVEKLGGTITFTSTEGKGTTFTIALPNVASGA